MHTLTLTNGLRLIAHNLLHIPETFKTPSEVMTAAKIVALLNCPSVKQEEATEVWQSLTVPAIELSEKQRDLLKAAVEKHASMLPPTRHVVALLSQLGFE